MCKPTINECLACVASVSVWFGSKERPRNRILGFGRARNETRAKKWKWGEGEGKDRNACRQTPRFWKPAFASERSAWLARLVEQCWHVSIKGLFHTERTVWYVTRKLIFCGCCLFWSARFALQYKNIFFDLFWNVRLFLRLNKGFRSFNLFSKVPPESDCLLFANAMVSCNVSCWAQLVSVFWRDVEFSQMVIYRLFC